MRQYYDEIGMTSEERDKLITTLRNRGQTYRQIGAAVGLTANGVMHALRRIAEGRPGRNPRA